MKMLGKQASLQAFSSLRKRALNTKFAIKQKLTIILQQMFAVEGGGDIKLLQPFLLSTIKKDQQLDFFELLEPVRRIMKKRFEKVKQRVEQRVIRALNRTTSKTPLTSAELADQLQQFTALEDCYLDIERKANTQYTKLLKQIRCNLRDRGMPVFTLPSDLFINWLKSDHYLMQFLQNLQASLQKQQIQNNNQFTKNAYQRVTTLLNTVAQIVDYSVLISISDYHMFSFAKGKIELKDEYRIIRRKKKVIQNEDIKGEEDQSTQDGMDDSVQRLEQKEEDQIKRQARRRKNKKNKQRRNKIKRQSKSDAGQQETQSIVKLSFEDDWLQQLEQKCLQLSSLQ